MDEVSDEVLEEGCYHLLMLGMSPEEVAEKFAITAPRVEDLRKTYAKKLSNGTVSEATFDRVFWESVKKEAEGDVKLTFLSGKGFHHAWKSELDKLDGPALMSIYEASKDFLGADPNQKFLDVPPPKGYDPLAMDRELRKAVAVIGEMLAEKWKAESAQS
jgi:hypothetical protein